MKHVVLASLVLIGLDLTGCGTIPEAYHPRTVGAISDEMPENGLLLHLSSPANVVQVGSPAVFSVVVRNTTDHAIWLPKKPQQAFFWTYPNGRHDCYVIDREQSRYFQKSECQLLAPGHELGLEGMVETSYFNRPGITEFRAEIDVPKNTNPELTPFWSGRLISNAFGLQIVPLKKTPGARAGHLSPPGA